MGWPAKDAGHGLLAPKPDASLDELAWMSVLDPSQWVCQRLEWLSPPGVEQHCPAAGMGAMGIMARRVGVEEQLFKSAGRDAFYDVPLAGLTRIVSFIPEHGDVGVTFFDCSRCLVEALLPELSEEELLQVLSKRVLPPPPTEASLFTREALEDCFDKEDAEHTHKYLERSAEPVQKEYQRQYVKFRQAHLERQSQTRRKRKRRGPAAGAEAAAAVAPDSTHSLCPL